MFISENNTTIRTRHNIQEGYDYYSTYCNYFLSYARIIYSICSYAKIIWLFAHDTIYKKDMTITVHTVIIFFPTVVAK